MSITIAVIDDDEAVRDSLAALLESVGYLVNTYATSSAFLKVAQVTKPDGVILDHQMRGMTGVELAECMTEKELQTTIVMISGNLTDAIRNRAKDAGIAAILEKPFSDDALISTIEAKLGRADNQ